MVAVHFSEGCEKCWWDVAEECIQLFIKYIFNNFGQIRKDIYGTIVVSVENFACFKYGSYFRQFHAAWKLSVTYCLVNDIHRGQWQFFSDSLSIGLCRCVFICMGGWIKLSSCWWLSAKTNGKKLLQSCAKPWCSPIDILFDRNAMYIYIYLYIYVCICECLYQFNDVVIHCPLSVSFETGEGPQCGLSFFK